MRKKLRRREMMEKAVLIQKLPLWIVMVMMVCGLRRLMNRVLGLLLVRLLTHLLALSDSLYYSLFGSPIHGNTWCFCQRFDSILFLPLAASIPPPSKDVDVLSARFLHWAAAFQSSVNDAARWQAQVARLEAEVRRAEDEQLRESAVADQLKADRVQLMDQLNAAMQMSPRLAEAEKRNHELALEMEELKTSSEAAAMEAEARAKEWMSELESEKAARKRDAEAAKEAWRKEAEKRDAASQSLIQQLRQTSEKEKVCASFVYMA